MIKYNFGEIECKISYDDFLCLECDDIKKYKSEFKDIPDLYEFIDKNIKDITHMIFDNYEYYLQNGKLHNLYGAALIRYNVESTYLSKPIEKSSRFYIDGRLVLDSISKPKGCSNLEDFKYSEIFFYDELSYKLSGRDPLTGMLYRRKVGVDYIKTMINLDDRIKMDQRYKKLKMLSKL